MVNVTDAVVPTGTYSFHNVKHGKVIDAPGPEDPLKPGPGASAAGKKSDKWVVALTKDKKVTIRNGETGRYATALDDYGATDNLFTDNEFFEWVIQKVASPPDAYKIFSMKAQRLVWSLPTADGSVEFGRNPTANTPEMFWTIQKEEDIPGFGSDGIFMGPLPTLIPDAVRPAHKVLGKNNLQITVPQGWEVTISCLALGNAINAFYLQAVTKASTTVDTFQFYNDRNNLRKPMKLKDKEEMAYQAAASLAPLALGLTCYSSTNSAKRDPFVLSHSKGNESVLSVEYVDKTPDVRNFPDYRKYYVTCLEGETGTNAIITIVISKTEGDLTKPTKPEKGTVNEGTNPKCDEPRPDCMDEYLKFYDSVFLVDDSGSMEGSRWTEAKASLIAVADEAMRFDTDGIELLFFNSKLRKNNIKGEDAMLDLFKQVSPDGGTPTGARLDAVLGEYIGKLDAAIGKPEYEKMKLLDLICITDGEPTDDPEPVLLKWAAYLKSKKHHPNQVGVQFVQVGNVATATTALLKLASLDTNGIVDTVPFNGSFTPERLVRVLLGGVMPNMRKKP
ncbi:hypothetical protein FRB95_007706 [Tulasnella sp. JGI-2019a]|nr:hypothetical protein FRB95_007706 [Tulasnella sp. JGI-2019a]